MPAIDIEVVHTVEPMTDRDLLLRALRDPAAMRALSPRQWDVLVRQARRADMTARLALAARATGVEPASDGPGQHFAAALVLAGAQHAEVLREVTFLSQALAPLHVPLTLMKGAAYLAAGLPPARGRTFSDIDIMVPKARLAEVEASLMQHGWATTHHSPYDQRYYRRWMHELPPMQHIVRHTVVDVHHAILPETARLRPDPARILAAARPVPGMPGVQVLAPADMLLHSMTHLFHNEELSHGLRDLSDLDLLLRQFGPQPDFWDGLLERAGELGLRRPLYYGLQQTRAVFDTPVPDGVRLRAEAGAPARALAPLMQALWRRGLRPEHPTAALAGTAPALLALYVRAHWLRMPPLQLARHLTTKALRRRGQDGPEPRR